MHFGERITERRLEQGLTREQLADRMNLTPEEIKAFETGKRKPDVFQMLALSDALRVRLRDLIGKKELARTPLSIKDQFFGDPNMFNKLKSFADAEGLTQTRSALFFAREMHEGQYRSPSHYSKEKIPYFVHPLTMACHAHALGIRNDAVLAAALLHDVCEDCGIDPPYLPFSSEVREAVSLLTKPGPMTPELTEIYYRNISYNSTAAIVKALDRCNNVSTMMLGFPKHRVLKYIDETQRYVFPLLDFIKEHYLEYNDAVFVIKYQITSILQSAKAAILW